MTKVNPCEDVMDQIDREKKRSEKQLVQGNLPLRLNKLPKTKMSAAHQAV